MKKKKVKYIPNTGSSFMADALLQCPFCGSEPELKFIGNDHTKSREVEIKCSNKICRAMIVNAGIRSSSEKVANWSIESWNKRD